MDDSDDDDDDDGGCTKEPMVLASFSVMRRFPCCPRYDRIPPYSLKMGGSKNLGTTIDSTSDARDGRSSTAGCVMYSSWLDKSVALFFVFVFVFVFASVLACPFPCFFFFVLGFRLVLGGK